VATPDLPARIAGHAMAEQVRAELVCEAVSTTR
jgi:uncharacterized protein YsxB (DUF464 family)